MMTEHRQVRIRVNGRDARVDEGIAPLLREMWRADVDTWMSCENQGKMPGFTCDVTWVYLGAGFAQRFLSIVAGVAALRTDLHNLHDRMYDAPCEEEEGMWWRFDASTVPIRDGMLLMVGIRFPTTDLPGVTEIMGAYNRARRQCERDGRGCCCESTGRSRSSTATEALTAG